MNIDVMVEPQPFTFDNPIESVLYSLSLDCILVISMLTTKMNITIISIGLLIH